MGATRLLRIGEQQLFEKLVGIDDEEHILWVPARCLLKPCASTSLQAGKPGTCDRLPKGSRVGLWWAAAGNGASSHTPTLSTPSWPAL